jgi:tyrosyl-tRNA synthetase
MFGKIMSTSDELMWRYYELLSFRSSQDIDGLKRQVNAGLNPMEIKFQLAIEIVARFHNTIAAEQAKQSFISRFRQHHVPENLEVITVSSPSSGIFIGHLLKEAGLVAGTAEAMRLIQQGGVKIDGERIENPKLMLLPGTEHVYQVGKRRIAKVKIKPSE